MNKAKLIMFFVFMCFFSVSQTKQKTKNKKPLFIVWTKDRKLKINDFTLVKKKFKEGDYTGSTFADIHYNIQRFHDTVFVLIQCVFNTKLSWLNIGDTTKSGLAHEQGHFDLGEYIVRKMRKEFLDNYNPDKKINIERDLKKIRNKYIIKKNKLGRRYDKETDHSVNKLKQIEWETIIIPKMLKEYERFENAMILIN